MPLITGTDFHILMLETICSVALGDTYATAPRAALETNCVLFGHDVLTQVFDLSWSRDEYQDSLLWDASKPFSSVDVLVRKGVATDLHAGIAAGHVGANGWFAWQRWAKLDPPSRGHFGFAYAKPEAGRMCLVDATNANRQWWNEYDLAPLHEHFGVPEDNIRVVALHGVVR
jgi:hypothetical protein